MWHEQKKRATWWHMRPPCVAHMYMCVRVSVRVWACAHVCVCAHVYDYGESTMLRIFANSLIMHTLYSHVLFFLIFPCETLFRVLSAQVTWQFEEHLMRTLKMNLWSSLTARGTRWRDETVRSSISRGITSKIIPILGIYNELKGIMVNKGRIHRELRYFRDIFWKLIKSDKKLMV